MDWHRRFVQQAYWTESLRKYLFKSTGLNTARRVLEVGCGTGAILAELNTKAEIHGLEINHGRLLETRIHAPQAAVTCGDAHYLPYSNNSFDITFCHFTLLWVRNPLQALCEMKRVTRDGGNILALAEPDYMHRVDEPSELAVLGRLQMESLHRQGADPSIGVQLAGLFTQADISIIETGSLASETGKQPAKESFELEWEVLKSDLMGMIPVAELTRLKRMDENAGRLGIRVLHVPTYFAWGQKMPMV